VHVLQATAVKCASFGDEAARRRGAVAGARTDKPSRIQSVAQTVGRLARDVLNGEQNGRFSVADRTPEENKQ